MIRQDRQIQRILFLWCFVFFLHAVADPAITYLAVVILDVGTEVNPLLRVWLQHGWRSFLLIHVPLYALGVGGFVLLRWLFRQADRHEQRQAYWLALIVMSGLSIWGVVLVVNNLWVIWAGI
jgi:hypothetical protein